MREVLRQMEEARAAGPSDVLTLTADQWSLYTGAIDHAVRALNQALREAATIVQDEIRTGQVASRSDLESAISRAIYDQWVPVAQQHQRVGASDTAVRDVAIEALRKHFRETRANLAGGRKVWRMGEARGESATEAFRKRVAPVGDAVAELSTYLDHGISGSDEMHRAFNAMQEATGDLRDAYKRLTNAFNAFREAERKKQ